MKRKLLGKVLEGRGGGGRTKLRSELQVEHGIIMDQYKNKKVGCNAGRGGRHSVWISGGARACQMHNLLLKS